MKKYNKTFEYASVKLKEKILDKCDLSDTMRNYLLEDYVTLTKFNLIDIIINSDISLTKKKDIFEELLYDDKESDNEYEKNFEDYFNSTKLAIDELYTNDPNQLFIFNLIIYEDSINDSFVYESVPFKGYIQILDYIKENYEEDFNKDEDFSWVEIEKYTLNNDKYERKYLYYLNIGESEPSYYSKDNLYCDGYTGKDMDIPIPFAPGDILTLNISPFCINKYVLLIEVDNSDCCGVQCLYKNDNGLYDVTALKHGFCYDTYFSPKSPMNNLIKTSDDIKDDHELDVLRKVSKFIEELRNKGIIITSSFFYNTKNNNLLTEENLINLIENFYTKSD